TQRRLTQADERLAAREIQRISQTDGGGGFALPRRGRRDRRDEDELALGAGVELAHVVQRDLGLVAAVQRETLFRQAQPLLGHPGNRLHLRALRDLDVSQCHRLTLLLVETPYITRPAPAGT